MPTHLGGDPDKHPLSCEKGSSFGAGTDRKTSLLRDRTARRAVKRAYRIWVSDAAHHCVQLRNDLLFTMSDNLHRAIDEIDAAQIQMHGRVFEIERSSLAPAFAEATAGNLRGSMLAGQPKRPRPRRLVEPDGIEPTTSCLQSRRSPN